MADQKLKKSAEELRSKGRGGDSILAHINPHEAAMLKMMGGSGTKNPDTGLPEFLYIQADYDKPPEGTPGELAGTVYRNSPVYQDSGGGLFGALAQLDPSTAISRELTNLTSPIVDPLKKAVSTGLADVDKNLSLSKNAPVFAAIALSFVIPGIGEAIGASLMEAGVVTSAAEASAAATAAGATAAQAAAAGAAATQTATAVGTAIANATRMVAQGSTVEQAITQSATAAAVGSQTPDIAKQIDDVVRNPAVTNLIASSAASAVQTAANGGSETDVINNVKGALIGSGVSSATGSSIAGRAAGGGVTGGVAGALIGAAGAIGSDAAKAGAPPAGTVAVQDASGNTLYTDGQKYYNADGSINTAATESAGVVSGVGTDVAGTATGMADKSAPGVSVGGSNLSLGTDSYGYRIPAGTKYANGLTYEGNGQWVLPDGRRMVVGSSAWGDSDDFGGINKFNPNQSYVTSFGTFGTSETGTTGTGVGGTGTGGGGGSGTGGGAGGGSSVGGVGGGGAQTSDAQGVGTDSAIIDLLGLGGGANVGGNVVVDSGVGAGNVAGNVAIDTGATGNVGNATGNVVISDAGLGGGTNAAVGGDTSVSLADRDILNLTGITQPASSVSVSTQPEPVAGQPISFTPAVPRSFTPAVAPGRGVETDEERIARINKQSGGVIVGEADYTSRSRPGTGTGTGNATGNVVISDGGAGAGGGNAAGNVVVGPGTGTGGPGGNVTIDAGGGGDGNAAANVSGNVAITEDKPVVDDKKVVDEDKKDEPIDDTYTPDIFIYGKTTPKTKTRTTTDLSTTLQAPFYPSSTLGQALTGYRGAGEIEGKKTGKPRKNVWNEESLRLKDALGL